ncbi:hypothetical protein [Campylobacter phage CJLB-12]|nr:hypothetical protein [Campylobacter phage CJLB-12]
MRGLVYKSPLKVDLDLAESYKGNIFLYNEPIKNDPEYSIQDSINLVSKPDPATFSESISLDDTNHFNIDFNFNETAILRESVFDITSETIDSDFSRDPDINKYKKNKDFKCQIS